MDHPSYRSQKFSCQCNNTPQTEVGFLIRELRNVIFFYMLSYVAKLFPKLKRKQTIIAKNTNIKVLLWREVQIWFDPSASDIYSPVAIPIMRLVPVLSTFFCLIFSKMIFIKRAIQFK